MLQRNSYTNIGGEGDKSIRFLVGGHRGRTDSHAIEAPSIFGMTIMVAQSDTQDCELQTMDGAKVGLGCRLDTI